MNPATLDQLTTWLLYQWTAVQSASSAVRFCKIYKKFIFTLKSGSSTQGNPLFTTTLRTISKSLD